MNTKQYTYRYERPALSVDCVVFGYDEDELKILLIQRDIEPYKNVWALPGGFVRIKETLEEAALRELKEETSVENLYLEQLYSFGALDRDPRERVVTVSYYALVKISEHKAKGGSDASDAQWFSFQKLPKLGFDHKEIIEVAFKRLQAKVRYEPIGFELLPKKFPFSAIERLYEAVLQRKIDRRNFRKKMLSMGIIKQLETQQENVAHRKGFYYAFDKKEYERLKKKGFNFEI
jgi:8-oxo-dGTP diphosphatase